MQRVSHAVGSSWYWQDVFGSAFFEGSDGKAKKAVYVCAGVHYFGAARQTSDGALDELERLIMGRCEASMPVIITTNLSPEDIEMRRGTRVWSRLKGMARDNVFVIKGGDFRQKVEWEV